MCIKLIVTLTSLNYLILWFMTHTLNNHLTHALVIFPSAQFSLNWLMCHIIAYWRGFSIIWHCIHYHKCFLACVMGLFLGQHSLGRFSKTIMGHKSWIEYEKKKKMFYKLKGSPGMFFGSLIQETHLPSNALVGLWAGASIECSSTAILWCVRNRAPHFYTMFL